VGRILVFAISIFGLKMVVKSRKVMSFSNPKCPFRDMAVKTHKKHMLKEHPEFVKVSHRTPITYLKIKWVKS
jgi:hypothetical protein